MLTQLIGPVCTAESVAAAKAQGQTLADFVSEAVSRQPASSPGGESNPPDWKAILGAELFAKVQAAIFRDGLGWSVERMVAEAMLHVTKQEAIALAIDSAPRPQALRALMESWMTGADEVAPGSKEVPASGGGVKPSFTKEHLKKIFFRMEGNQQVARGALSGLSAAVACGIPEAAPAVGLKALAAEFESHVSDHWDNISNAFAALREDWGNAELAARLERAFNDMVPAMRCAAACVNTLALALKEQAEVNGRFHAEGTLQGYDDMAVFWPSKMLEACDQWARPEAYFSGIVAGRKGEVAA